jgi:hypothetical protein
LAVLGARSQVRQIHAKKTICWLITVNELLRVKHQNRIWQVVQNLGESVPGFFGLRLHNEELCEDASDEIGHREHRGDPNGDFEKFDFLVGMSVHAYDDKLYGQTDR